MDDDRQGETPPEEPWFLRIPRRWVQRAALRVLLLVAAAAPLLAAAGAPREVVVLILLAPLLALPGAVVEGLVEDRWPTRRLRVEATALCAALTLPVAALVWIQAAYVGGVLAGGVDAGFQAMQERVHDPVALAGDAVTMSLSFVLALLYRLRYGGLARQLSVLMLEAIPTGLVMMIVAAALGASAAGQCASLCATLVVMTLPAATALLVVFRLADRIDRRLRGVPD